jgi:ATP-binding cassette subfamily B protein
MARSITGRSFGIGLLGLGLAFVGGDDSPAVLAIGVGGVFLAYHAFHKLGTGMWHCAGAAIAWKHVAPLFDAAARPVPGGSPACIPPPVSGADHANGPGMILDMHEIIFRYRSVPVLRGCSLRIDVGDRLLLESLSGGGKSTLTALLSGLRLPESGLLLLRGLDRQTLGVEGWRRRVAAAPQFHENYVFAETFAFNLLMGRRWPPCHTDVDAAEGLCREIGLDDLLARMPAGLWQLVGETGWQLSHGERSRLYIARALLQGADLVVLDESFAVLDP